MDFFLFSSNWFIDTSIFNAFKVITVQHDGGLEDDGPVVGNHVEPRKVKIYFY